MRRALLVLALLSSPVWAQEPTDPTDEPTEVPLEEAPPTFPDRPTDGEHAEALEPLEAQVASGATTAAIAAAEALISDTARPQLHADAWALLGSALEAADYPLAAVDAWTQSLSIDPRALTPQTQHIIDTAEVNGITRPLEVALVHSEADLPQVRLYTARHALREGDLDGALADLAQIKKSSKHFPEAKLLEGVVHSQSGNYQSALAALATAQARATDPSDTWRWTVEVNLARVYFALGNQPKALTHYGNIDRNAPGWLHVHFETAWAHFRMGDMAGTLSATHSLKSPFFTDGYWAEAELLEAYALVYMCKFPSARERVKSFEQTYKPIRAQLDGISRVTAEQAWQELERAEAGEPLETLPVQAVYRYRWDVRAKATFDAVGALRDEQKSLAKAGLTATAERLNLLEQQLTRAEGERILATARAMRAELTDMLQDIEITKLDLLDLEKRLYQQAAVVGDLGMGDPLGNIRELRQKSDSQIWPFQGEYWADEVGYYRITARSDCPVNLQIGGR